MKGILLLRSNGLGKLVVLISLAVCQATGVAIRQSTLNRMLPFLLHMLTKEKHVSQGTPSFHSIRTSDPLGIIPFNSAISLPLLHGSKAHLPRLYLNIATIS